MSTRRPLNPFNPSSAGHPVKSETSRIAGFYSEDMSKEAVGKLFRSYGDDSESEEEYEDAEPVEEAEEAVEESEDDNDSDSEYEEYINSYSRLGGKPRSRRISRQERVLLNEVGPRKIQESVSSMISDGGGAETDGRPGGYGGGFADGQSARYEIGGGSSLLSALARNQKYVALASAVIILVIITLLIVQTNSLNAELNKAKLTITENEQIVRQAKIDVSNADEQQAQIVDLQADVRELTAQLDGYIALGGDEPEPSGGTEPDPDEGQGETETTGGTHTVEADTYIVQSGDALWGIINELYEGGWTQAIEDSVKEANGLNETADIQEGQTLILPRV